MKQGLVRRIRNGTTTEIWNINWIARPDLVRPLVARVADPQQLVSHLIDSANARWNTQLIHEVFLPFYSKKPYRFPYA